MMRKPIDRSFRMRGILFETGADIFADKYLEQVKVYNKAETEDGRVLIQFECIDSVWHEIKHEMLETPIWSNYAFDIFEG